MLQTASEIKAQILKDVQQEEPLMPIEQRAAQIELGTAIKRMSGSKGWKIVEAWLLRKLDVDNILSAKPEQLAIVQAKAQAFAEVIKQVNWWIAIAEKLDRQEEDKKE